MELDQNQLLMMVLASVNDDVKAQRISELMTAAKAHQDAKADAEAQAALNTQLLAEAAAERQKAQGLLSEHGRASAALDEEKAKLADLYNELNAEKERWNSMRQQADGQMQLREAAAANADKDLRDREIAVTAREGAVGSREDAAKVMADHARMVIEWAKRGPDIE